MRRLVGDDFNNNNNNNNIILSVMKENVVLHILVKLKCYCDENTLSLILPDMKSTSPK